jgi:hypothetical protein
MDATWFSAIMNGGAMAVLAYHFLVGLPAILTRIADEQRAERQFWAGQADKDRGEFARRTEMIVEEISQLRMLVMDIRQGNVDKHP